MSKITESDAWEAIEAACRRGTFVPIVGVDVASSPIYADACASTGDFFAATPCSVQTLELAGVAARVTHLAKALEAEDGDTQSSAAIYAQQLDAGARIRLDSPYCAPPTPGNELAEDGRLSDFQRALVRLNASLTTEWATSLAEQPCPLAVNYADRGAPITRMEVIGNLRAAITAAAAMGDPAHEPTGSMRREDTRWIYLKLLRLAADIVGSNESLWSDAEFFRRQKQLIAASLRHGQKTGWVVSEDGQLVTEDRNRAGVKLAHLVWLEHLLQFTLLTDSRAYRTRHELAFALSLNDTGVGIPRMPADPLEIGLLYSEANVGEDSRTLEHLIEYTSRDADGQPRQPGNFHRTIAKMVRHNIDRLEAEGRAEDARKQVIISLGLDMETERALEDLFDDYQILIPVNVILRSRSRETDGASDDGEGKPEPTKPEWLLGHARRDAERHVITWQYIGDSPHRLGEEPGPLLIKLFGSPGHELPTAAELKSRHLAQETKSANPNHRVVLDELELLNLLHRLTPEEASLEGLLERLRSSQLFFFSENTFSWGDRLPYLMMDKIQGAGGSQRRKTRKGSDGKGAESSSIAMARGNSFVSGVWNRLNVDQLGDADFERIASRIVTEVEKW